MSSEKQFPSVSKDGTEYDLYRNDQSKGRSNDSGKSRPTVVLIHGFGLERNMWKWQVDALKEQYTVLTYDLVGSGNSARPHSTPSLTMFSQQLLSLLDELQLEKAAVFGFSLGGMISRRFAMDHPERLWALGILHSAYQRDKAAHDAIQSRVYQAQSDGPEATIEAALERWFTEDFRNNNSDTMDFIRRSILANDKNIYPLIYQVLVDGVTELVNPQPPINCPTLVMTADEDYGNSVAMTHAIAAEIPGAVTTILPGLRHMAMLEAPAVFNHMLIDFLHQCSDQYSA